MRDGFYTEDRTRVEFIAVLFHCCLDEGERRLTSKDAALTGVRFLDQRLSGLLTDPFFILRLVAWERFRQGVFPILLTSMTLLDQYKSQHDSIEEAVAAYVCNVASRYGEGQVPSGGLEVMIECRWLIQYQTQGAV